MKYSDIINYDKMKLLDIVNYSCNISIGFYRSKIEIEKIESNPLMDEEVLNFTIKCYPEFPVVILNSIWALG